MSLYFFGEWRLVLIALVIGLAIYSCLELYNRTLRTYTIKIAAGSPTGEAQFAAAQADIINTNADEIG